MMIAYRSRVYESEISMNNKGDRSFEVKVARGLTVAILQLIK